VVARDVAQETQRARDVRGVAGLLVRAQRGFRLFAGRLEFARVPQRLAPPERRLGGVHAVQPPLEHLEVPQRRGRIASAPPRSADEVEHELRREIVIAGLEQVRHAVLHDAT
jgi:hypothetical protein